MKKVSDQHFEYLTNRNILNNKRWEVMHRNEREQVVFKTSPPLLFLRGLLFDITDDPLYSIR